MRRVAAAGLVLMLVLVAGVTAPAAAYPRPGRTERVSVASDGAQGDGISFVSFQANISAEGRFVAFRSSAPNLVADDTNGIYDIFVHDRGTGRTERVSVASDGTQGNANSSQPVISPDGRHVAFNSLASDLVPGDANGDFDIFIHDRETGTTELVSVASDGTQGNGSSWAPAISADGRHVAFMSWASNLVPDDDNLCDTDFDGVLDDSCSDVFVHDRATGVTERVSVATDGTQGNGESNAPSLSADGRYVGFFSEASNLVPGDTNGRRDVFIHDRETGVTELVSVASDGTQGDGDSLEPFVGADGRHVAFPSYASNLVPGDTNAAEDVFIHDRETGVTERVSVASNGAEGDGGSSIPSLTPDLRFAGFESAATNLVPGDTNGESDVFIRDLTTGVTERVSVGSDGAEGTGTCLGGLFPPDSLSPSLSADGRFVSFQSCASSLVPGDTNDAHDAFVRDRGPSLGVGEFSAVPGAGTVSVSGWATLSGAVVTSAGDPPDDGRPGAGPAGGELTGASLTYRPEQEDLLARLHLTSLPSLQGGGAPGILYALRLELGGVPYEVRALRAGATDVPPAEPHFALYRCEDVCLEAARLTGGIGTTGPDILVSVPLSSLGAEEGTALSGILAFTALGEAVPGELVPLDEVGLSDVSVPVAGVELGIAPAGTPEEEVAFDIPATLSDGAFSGTVETSSHAAGAYEVWARACLGEVCAATSGPLTLE